MTKSPETIWATTWNNGERFFHHNEPAIGGMVEFKSTSYTRTDNWQPIETAPKDGTWLLLFTPDHWSTGLNFNGRHVFVCSFNAQANCWMGEGGWAGPEFNPTKWQPLPAPPKETNK